MENTNQPPAGIQETPAQIDIRISKLLPLLKELGPWFYALTIGTLYVVGFLVLNSNLAKSGVLDFEFLNARYFLASAGFVFYLVCFYLFGGRAALFSPKWLATTLAKANQDGSKPIWSFVLFVHSMITAIFFLCLSAALFTGLAIGSSETQFFYSVLAGAFAIQYTLDVTNLDVRFPRLSKVTVILTDLIAIYAFFAHSNSPEMHKVFWNYFVIFFFINLVLDQVKRFKINADWVVFTGIYAAVVLFGSAIAYGNSIYGQVSTKLGGAKPQTVSVGISDAARTALPSTLFPSSSHLIEGDLIHQTPEYTYLAMANHTIRLRTSDVITVVSTAAVEKNLGGQPQSIAASQAVTATSINRNSAAKLGHTD